MIARPHWSLSERRLGLAHQQLPENEMGWQNDAENNDFDFRIVLPILVLAVAAGSVNAIDLDSN